MVRRLAVLLGCVNALHALPAWSQTPLEVVVTSLDPEAQTITAERGGVTRTLPLASDFRVIVAGKPGRSADLRGGEEATLYYDATAKLVRAAWIESGPGNALESPMRRELVTDGGFERVTDAVTVVGWERQSGFVESAAMGRGGGKAVLMTGGVAGDEAKLFSAPRVALRPGGIYELSLWARGRGKLRLNVYQYDAANFIGTDFLEDEPGISLTDRWQQVRCVYAPTDERLRKAALCVVVSGSDAKAVVDDASFVFDQNTNPGFVFEEPAPSRELRVAVQAFQADAEVFIGGRPVALDGGVAVAQVSEGMAAIAVKATARGYRPRVRFRIIGHPETDGRWRVSSRDAAGWSDVDFDDRNWPLASSDADGFMWTSSAKAGVACFRQVLLWNERHYGPDRCILPMVKEWGFSQDGFDNLLLALYSPLPRDLEGYEFVLDVPEQFEVVGMDKPFYQRYVTNEVPARVVSESLHRDGRPMRRYRIAFASSQVPANATHYAWIPLLLRGGEPGSVVYIRYHRRANGNFTECEQSLAVRILPPVNGRQPRKVFVAQYCPVLVSTLSPIHMNLAISQAAAIGFNLARLEITEPGWGPQWNAYKRAFYAALVAKGFSTSISSPEQFPFYGSHVEGHQSDAFLRWVAATPAAQARYYDGRRWEPRSNNMYCPTFVADEGAGDFRRLVAKTYSESLARTPKASVLFLDYEKHAWRGKAEGGEGASSCFCDRCKRRFREWAGLPPSQDLTNDVIHDSLYRQWSDFHAWQMTEVQREVKAAANQLGLRSMIYSWASFHPFWSQIAGKADIAFLGMPGNGVAGSATQKAMDDEGVYLRLTQRIPQTIGQRFSFLGMSTEKGGWSQLGVLSNDGFVQARSWKSQILRIVAAFGGGVDLQNAGECVAGMPYWIGEATRIIATHEELFLEGERCDDLVTSEQIAYPDLLVLRKGSRRLVLLFNESDADKQVTVKNLGLEPGQRARQFEQQDWGAAESIDLVVPAGDAVAVEIEAAPTAAR